MTNTRRAFPLLAVVFLSAVPLVAQSSSEDLNFLHGMSEFPEIRRMLPSYLRQAAGKLLDQRERAIAQIATLDDIRKRREYVRDRMLHDLSGLPQRTPLNARVAGTLLRDGYRIEKIIFESQPQFYVTANLYLPAQGQPPYPAILYPLGHETGAKAYPVWQQMLGSLARKGYVALTWDPVGQGEREQFYDEDLQDTKLRSSTTEHTVLGIQCLLLGDHMARYTIWDGMRALDYLLSRKEVDPKRVACTGNSGGGTHTAYLSALDDRIQVAAPSCYITSWRWMLRTIGPQDAEQVFPYWLRDGLDYPDFLYAFAPKPYQMLTAIRDFFPIDGARDTFHEAEQVFSRIGAADKLRTFEADDGHGYSKPRRLTAYNWFSRWLKGSEDREPEPEIQISTAEELNCTNTGRVATSLGGETVHSLIQKRAGQMKIRRPVLTSRDQLASYREAIIRRARETSGFTQQQGAVPMRPYGTISRAGYRIEKLIYDSEPGIRIPALLYVPDGGAARKASAVYVDGRGKAAPAGDLEQLVNSGLVVLSIDARGLGETQASPERDGDFPRYFGDYNDAMTAILIGKTLAGLRAQDISRGVDLLAGRSEVDPQQIYGFGKNAGASPMLYAALFDERLRRVALEDMLISYESVVKSRIHRQIFEQIVPAALQYFDFPDLVGAIAPRPVWIVNAVNPLGKAVATSEVRNEYAPASKAFQFAGVEGMLRIQERRAGQSVSAVYREMLK